MLQDNSPVTDDKLLNGRILLRQPAKGFRVAIDTIFVAAAVPVRAGEKVLDLGCGVGGALLCLAARVPDLVMTGIEVQQELFDLARWNIKQHAQFGEFEILLGDILDMPPGLKSGNYDHVMTNPPFHDKAAHDPSPRAGKNTAQAQSADDLAAWCDAAHAALGDGGVFTLIHRADREKEILGFMEGKFGDIEIIHLLPHAGEPPKRIIIRARKNTAGSAHRHAGLILHEAGGGYTTETENILRNAAALV